MTQQAATCALYGNVPAKDLDAVEYFGGILSILRGLRSHGFAKLVMQPECKKRLGPLQVRCNISGSMLLCLCVAKAVRNIVISRPKLPHGQGLCIGHSPCIASTTWRLLPQWNRMPNMGLAEQALCTLCCERVV